MSVRHLSLGVFYILQPKINFQELIYKISKFHWSRTSCVHLRSVLTKHCLNKCCKLSIVALPYNVQISNHKSFARCSRKNNKLRLRNKFIQRYFVGDTIPLGVAFECFQPLKAPIAGLLRNQIITHS